MPEIKFVNQVVLINSLVPAIMLGWDVYHNNLGTNPLEYLTHTTGTLTLVFLLLSLTVTPLRKMFKLPWIVQTRRILGLVAFFYGSLHLLCYIWFDKNFKFYAIVWDTWNRPFIFLGIASFFLMVPLAITSTKKMVKRLGGQRWIRLHRLVYLSAIAAVAHYYILVKADIRIPLAFIIALALLLAYRIISNRQKLNRLFQ